MRLALRALLVCTFACGCTPDAGSNPSSDSAAKLAPLDSEEAAVALASVESGPPDAQPELAVRALAQLERQRLGSSLAEGLEHLADAGPEVRARSAAPAISANVQLLDAACGGASKALLRELGQLDESSRLEMLGSRCELETFGLLSASEAMLADSTTLLLLHIAYAKLSAGGPLDERELALFRLAVRFGSRA